MQQKTHNGICTVGAYRGVLIRCVQCGGQRLYYIGADIHHTYASAAQCRAAIDAAPAVAKAAARVV